MPDMEKSNLNIIVPGTGCCIGEIMATRGPVYDIQRFGINFVSIPEDADILVLSGFISEDSVNNFIYIYELMKRPKWVFAVGSCAISGGRFCSSPDLIRKLHRNIPVDMYIPGCPPRPEAFIYALLRFTAGSIETGPIKVKNA